MKKFKLLVILSILTTGISFGSIDLDTSKIQNTTIETGKKGNTIININTPNEKGISVNDFENFQTKDGVVFNNSNIKMSISQLEGIINGNPNITKDQAKLILNRVNGVNRAEIESTLEAVGKDKVDMIFSSPNGVYLNGAKFIGFKDVTFTTAPVELDTNGNIQNLVVEKGNIEIGRKGLDASKLEQISLIGNSLYVDGEIRGKKVELNTHSSESFIKLSSSEFGSIYGDQINILVSSGDVGLNGDIIANKNISIIAQATKDVDNVINIKSLETGEDIYIDHAHQIILGDMRAENNIVINDFYNLQPSDTYAIAAIFEGNVQARNITFTDKTNTYWMRYENKGTIFATDSLNLSLHLDNSGVLVAGEVNFTEPRKIPELGIQNTGSITVLNDINGASGNEQGRIYNDGDFSVYGNINNIEDIYNNGEFLSYGNIDTHDWINNNGIMNVSDSINTNKLTNNGIMNIDGNVSSFEYYGGLNGHLITESEFVMGCFGYFENYGNIKAENIFVYSDYFKNYGTLDSIEMYARLHENFENYGVLNSKSNITIETKSLLNTGEINAKKLNLRFKNYSSQGGKITADQIVFEPYFD